MVEATEQTFAALVEQSQVPVLVEFHAPWCGPCQALKPVLQQIEQRRAGALKVVGVDYQTQPGLAVRFGVRALPTLILFRGGQAVGMRTDVPQSVPALEQMVDRVLSS